MSKICQVCGKGYQKGNLVPRGIGRRVTKRTIAHKQVNLRSKRFIIDGTSMKLILCASCLKRIKFEEKLAKAEVAAVATA
jgi:ribosomal protein L28